MATTMLALTPNSSYAELSSNFEIKQQWMYHEWNGSNPNWKKMIQSEFPSQEDLHPSKQDPQVEKIKELFNRMRGSFPAIWGDLRENGKWTKVQTDNLKPSWVRENVQIAYPSNDSFAVSTLDGIVLWKDSDSQKYKLIEGNHRVSAWLNSDNPQPLPSIIFIGELSV